MTAKLKTAVLGATGYSGLELTRILLRHPRLEKPVLLRRSADNGGASDLADVFPVLSGNGGYPLHSLSWPAMKQQGVKLLFLATPHEASRSLVPEALSHGLRVVDLSGAWRLKQAQNRAVDGREPVEAPVGCVLGDQFVERGGVVRGSFEQLVGKRAGLRRGFGALPEVGFEFCGRLLAHVPLKEHLHGELAGFGPQAHVICAALCQRWPRKFL